MDIFEALKEKPVHEVIGLAAKQGKCLRYIRRKRTAQIIHIGAKVYGDVARLQ
ncbi:MULTISPECIES: hypothetical protein [unclassified Neptuniibacter]|uniref:hypothetical protein n=1 Tax=unclassified Neptuniibacter TaxID=2630693 RepID=UPI0025F87C1B|nr:MULTISPECIES: hypothetical protein [unclassified Neptuniibacter]|tara:strand:+ start:12633 stop:12791 length:159 start_codon:yes stop_codon:yes gene_type:complete